MNVSVVCNSASLFYQIHYVWMPFSFQNTKAQAARVQIITEFFLLVLMFLDGHSEE